jgi:hypothetical protein
MRASDRVNDVPERTESARSASGASAAGRRGMRKPAHAMAITSSGLAKLNIA